MDYRQIGKGMAELHRRLERGDNMKIANDTIRELVNRSFNECYSFISEFISLTENYDNRLTIDFYKEKLLDSNMNTNHFFVDECISSIESHILIMNIILMYCDDDMKERVNEIKDKIESYITMIKLFEIKSLDVKVDMPSTYAAAVSSTIKYTANQIISFNKNTTNNTNEKVELKWLKVRTKK